ncbi:MAG TPA: tryptophan 7-halogenase [Fulvivirga sp.]|nr:tryptophan 7-halogenase [Fulvivirga sp.]
MQQDYDVIILGGGLAGLTLAMQLKQKEPSLKITVLERRKNEALDAAHKVGESTVELGTYYLREVLGLKDYLEEKHLHKHGLRFFLSPQVKESIEKRVEYGARNELFVPSHQIDRGIFENDVMAMISKLGVDVKMDTGVKDVNLSDEGHTVKYLQSGELKEISATWVVDATGRTNFLKRKEGLAKDTDHNINAVWFRVEGEIDVTDWSDDEPWKKYINPGLRRLGTIHFMGKGFWVWFIPLSSGNTSIGIVADPRFHEFSEINTIDKAYQWLEINEPICAKHLAEKRDKVLDFKILKNYCYNAEQFYSTDNWGIVGEAGAFLDPFYSPGTDFISIGNACMSDLIIRNFNGEDVYTRTIVYDKVYGKLFDNWLPIYQDKYELFDNAQVMCVKITWDFAIYWAIPSLMFTNGAFVNMDVLKVLFTVDNSFGERFGKLNKQVQNLCLEWGQLENGNVSEVYIDPMDVPFMKDFQKGLETIHKSDEELINQLESNLSLLETMAAEIFRVLSVRLKGMPSDLAIDPYQMSLASSRADLMEQSKSDSAKAPDSAIAEAISVLWLLENVGI